MSREQTNELVREQAMRIADIVTKANTRPPDPPLSDVGMACRLRDCAEVWEVTLWRLLDKVDRANDRSAEPVGSPAYVRRLRDEVAKDLCDGPGAEWTVGKADALIRALGYDPPGEGNPEPESPTVPLHCPKCGETTAGYLTTDVIFPHPTESMFRCGNPECEARWRVEFFEVTEDGED